MRLLIVTPSLGYGGAERVLSLLSAQMSGRGHDVTVLILNGSRGLAYDVPNRLVWRHGSVLSSLPSLVAHLAGNRYDVVFSSTRNLNYYLAIFRALYLIRCLVIRDNTLVSEMMKYMDRPGRTFIRILSGTYAWADAIICQSEDMKADVMRDLGVSAPPVHLIHNPANPSMRFNADTVRPNRFVTLGRLSPEKGYDRMIRALSGLKGDWEWHIYGTGPLESELKRLATRSGLDSQVFFHAPTQHVSAVFATASVFLCGSYVEGFPNGVLESVLSGVPVVAFRSLGGTREIIRHGFNGFLAADEAEFRESAWKSLHETWDRHAMALEASERFSFETIMGRYESLFTRLTNA